MARARQKKELTLKQSRFIEAYLESGNATDAARKAGYKGDDATLSVTGYENLRNPKIKKNIAERIGENGVTANEVIGTLANQMRADLTEALTENGSFSLEQVRARGLGKQIKSITVRQERVIEGEPPSDIIKVEFHSQQAAAIQLSRILGIEKAPAPNDEDKRREIVTRMLEKAMRQGMSLDEAKSALKLLGVDERDIESVSRT